MTTKKGETDESGHGLQEVGLTQAILLVECGLFSGIREDEKIQTYVQSCSREIDSTTSQRGRSCRAFQLISSTLLSKCISGSWGRESRGLRAAILPHES